LQKNIDLQNNAKRYLEFFDAVMNDTFMDNTLDKLVDKLIVEGNTTDADIKKILLDMSIQMIDELTECE